MVDPVEGSLAVCINTMKSARVNLHPEVIEMPLQFFDWIIFLDILDLGKYRTLLLLRDKLLHGLMDYMDT